MRRVSIVMAIVLVLAAVGVARAQEQPAPQQAAPQPGANENQFPRYIAFFFVGYTFPFVDQGQFDDARDAAGLDEFSFPWGFRFGFGIDYVLANNANGAHLLGYSFDGSWTGIGSSHSGRLASLWTEDGILRLDYAYWPTDWLSLRVTPGIGVMNWRYLLMMPHFNGRVAEQDFIFQPEGALRFSFGHGFVDLYGGYRLKIAKHRQLFSGDWAGARDFDELNLDCAVAGFNVGIQF